MVHVKSVFAALVEGRQPDLAQIAMKPVFAPESQPVARMIHGLQNAGSGCAIVVDEHGGVAGAVYLDDALEEIVGPLPDEFDQMQEGHHEIGPGKYELKGHMALPFACEVLNIEETGDEDTIGGFVTGLLKRIPEVNDTTDVGPYRCTVIEVHDRRISRLLFEKTVPDADSE